MTTLVVPAKFIAFLKSIEHEVMEELRDKELSFDEEPEHQDEELKFDGVIRD